jgi:F0F1-type ATP synthase assembly protein I
LYSIHRKGYEKTLDKKKTSGSIFTYSTIGIQLAATVILFIVGGYKLDEHLNRSPVFTTIGAVVGMVIGFYHLIKQLKDIDRQEKEERNK